MIITILVYLCILVCILHHVNISLHDPKISKNERSMNSRSLQILMYLETRPPGYKTFFVLSSTEHGISEAHKIKNA